MNVCNTSSTDGYAYASDGDIRTLKVYGLCGSKSTRRNIVDSVNH